LIPWEPNIAARNKLALDEYEEILEYGQRNPEAMEGSNITKLLWIFGGLTVKGVKRSPGGRS